MNTKIPYQFWLILAFAIFILFALIAPIIAGIVQFLVEVMVEIAYIVQALAVPCFCLGVLGGGAYLYYNSTLNKK